MTELSQLKPYKSFILARVKEDTDLDHLLEAILDDLVLILGPDSNPDSKIKARFSAQTAGQLEVGFIHYVEERLPSWTIDDSIKDTLNHLALVCRKTQHIAIYISDSRRKAAICHKIRQQNATGLAALEVIPQGILNAAFVKGPARTLWLSGTHRRTPVTADNKILAGLDLRYALDPLGDQTFHFTAARCVPELAGQRTPVGVAPGKSQIWIGQTPGWDEFRGTVGSLLTHIQNVEEPIRAPLPVVAIPSTDPGRVHTPFDVAIIPPELLTDDPDMDAETRQTVERWGYQTNFQVTNVDEMNFTAQVSLEGTPLGAVEFELDLSSPAHVNWTVEGKPQTEETEDLLKEALKYFRKKKWVKIWFESGHTISDGAVFEVRYRDMPFKAIKWANLGGFDVGKEKPEPLSEVGQQKSLFDWTQQHWPNLDASETLPGGWLASDDGAMEIADFIHLDDRASPPLLTLIHIKASGSTQADRQISVSDYEVVTSQAVKNLRYLDQLLISEGLESGIGKKIGKLVWHDRAPSNREEMIKVLSAWGTNYDKRVIVFQPRLTKTRLDKTRQNPTGPEMDRLRQLDTLLLSTQASCRSLGAEFLVVSQDI